MAPEAETAGPIVDIGAGLRPEYREDVVNVEIEDEVTVNQAVEWYEQGMDFADSLHVASAGPARKFATFDKALRRNIRRLAINELADL